MKRIYLVAAAIGLFMSASGRDGAATLILSFSGSFGPTTTLGGTALGADTPFTIMAAFDTTTGIPLRPGAEVLPTVATFNISGFGTFANVPGAGVNVGLADPSSNSLGVYQAVFANHNASADFGGIFTSATPPISAASPIPTIFSGASGHAGRFPFTIPLQGGSGDLVVNDIVSIAETATLTAVPEPSSLALSGMGLALVGVVAWRRAKRSSSPVRRRKTF